MNTIAMKTLYEMEYKRDVVLAVIIKHYDSAPRKAGSFMLVGAAGRLLGTIGGGAVEKRSEELAKECLKKKESAVHEYHLKSGADEDIGMVCGGDVTVLFQFLPAADENCQTIMRTILERFHNKQNGWLVLDLEGGAPFITDEQGKTVAGIGSAIEPPKKAASCVLGSSFCIPLCTGERVILFGAGHCNKALAPILDSVEFRVVLFDNRPEFADPAEYPFAEQVICADYCHISDQIELSPEDYIVIMTNGHVFDYEVEKQVLEEKHSYVGVIGSAKKTAFINKRLTEDGISPERLSEVYTPIGLPIKAVTPEEIAVSIAAEIIRVRANARAGVEDHPTHKPVH